MPHYDSTADVKKLLAHARGRVAFKSGGKVTKKTTMGEFSKGKRLRPGIRLKGGKSFIEEYRRRLNKKADGGIIDFKHGGQVYKDTGARGTSRTVIKRKETKKERSERIISKKTRKEKQADYIKKHGERPPRRKTLAVTDKYKKIRDSLGFKHGGNITVKNEKDSKKAFQIAIEKGLKNPEDHMYMYTKDGKDFFKHIGTRKYDSFKKGGKAKKIIKTIASPLTHIKNLMRAEGQGSAEVFRSKKVKGGEVGLDDYKKSRLSKWVKKYGAKGLRPQAKAEGGIISLKKGGKADKKWIQKATKGMRKDKPCTGKKFGSATCPPGSKRYNLAKTFKKMARSKHASGDMVRYI